MAVGVGIGIGSGNKEVKAANATSNIKTFFLDCNSFGDWDSESVCIHTWNGSDDLYVEATMIQDNYWTVQLDITGCSGYRWYRCEKGNTGTRWDESGWNGTISNNYCTINGWKYSASFSGDTSGCEETYEIANTSPSTSTKRVWVDPQNRFYDSNARAGLRVFNGSTPYKTYILGGSSQYCTVGSETYIFYVDIPVDYDCQLVRLHNVFNFVWTYGIDITPTTMDGYNTTKIVYQWNANIGGDNPDYSCNNESDPTVEYAKKVLDGYSTCVNSEVNGYAAYSEINTNILSKLTDTELSELRSSTFSAGIYGLRTYGEKIDYMANGGKAPSSLTRFLMLNKAFGENTSITLVVIISSLATIAAFAGYFFYKKKKEDR